MTFHLLCQQGVSIHISRVEDLCPVVLFNLRVNINMSLLWLLLLILMLMLMPVVIVSANLF